MRNLHSWHVIGYIFPKQWLALFCRQPFFYRPHLALSHSPLSKIRLPLGVLGFRLSNIGHEYSSWKGPEEIISLARVHMMKRVFSLINLFHEEAVTKKSYLRVQTGNITLVFWWISVWFWWRYHSQFCCCWSSWLYTRSWWRIISGIFMWLFDGFNDVTLEGSLPLKMY